MEPEDVGEGVREQEETGREEQRGRLAVPLAQPERSEPGREQEERHDRAEIERRHRLERELALQPEHGNQHRDRQSDDDGQQQVTERPEHRWRAETRAALTGEQGS